jgi:hypothetical protein
MQVGRACAALQECFFYRLEDRPTSLQALGALPGVQQTVSDLGFDSFASFSQEARQAIEATYLLSTFCLTPPGDSPKRRGFYDAIVFGCALLFATVKDLLQLILHFSRPCVVRWWRRLKCMQCRCTLCTTNQQSVCSICHWLCRCIPVVFLEASRTCDLLIHPSELDSMTVLLPPEAAWDPRALASNLTALLPRVPAMQAALARHATRMTLAWSEMEEADHAAVGPDALDVALWGMTRDRDFGVGKP